jgi:hypothetical protein
MRRLAAGLLLAALLALALPAASIAGSYQVTTCNAAPEYVNNSWVWSSSDTSPIDHYTKHENCPERKGGTGENPDKEGGLSTTDTLELENGAPTGTNAGWTFTAPAGTSIEAITYERYIGHYLDPKNAWSPALRADGTIVAGETCLDTVEDSENCYLGAPAHEGAPLGEQTSLHAHTLTVGINCESAHEECITAPTYYRVWAAMYGATVTVNDPTPPTLGEPAGQLWEAAAAGHYSKGSEALQVSATDDGGGVRAISVSSEGKQLATYEATCNYTMPQPCALSTGSQSLSVPTTELHDGRHVISVIATDAAGNVSSVASREIDIANDAPPAPTNLTATPSGTTSYIVAWTDPLSVTTPITGADYQLCPPAGAACTPPNPAPPEGPILLTLPAPGQWHISVWLTNAAGLSGLSPATAYFTIQSPPETNPGAPGSSHFSPGSPESAHATARRLHLTSRVRHDMLYLHVSGAERISALVIHFTVYIRRRIVARFSRTIRIRHGQGNLAISLRSRLASAATIKVTTGTNSITIQLPRLRRANSRPGRTHPSTGRAP